MIGEACRRLGSVADGGVGLAGDGAIGMRELDCPDALVTFDCISLELLCTCELKGRVVPCICVAELEGRVPPCICAAELEGRVPPCICVAELEGRVPLSVCVAELEGRVPLSVCVAELEGRVVPCVCVAELRGTLSCWLLSGKPSRRKGQKP